MEQSRVTDNRLYSKHKRAVCTEEVQNPSVQTAFYCFIYFLLEHIFAVSEKVVDIVHDVAVVFRHLASHNVSAFVKGTADHMAFYRRSIWNREVLNLHMEILSFAVSEEIIIGDQSKAVGTDIVEPCFVCITGLFHSDGARHLSYLHEGIYDDSGSEDGK